jgi:hypothetical protein
MSAKNSLPDFHLPAQRIIELAGAQWVGVQQTDEGPLVLFRDPITTSTLALFEQGLTLAAVQERMLAAHAKFGVVRS